METEFIYWRHPSVPGIKIEEVCGAEDKSGRLWEELAFQVYSENGREGYREIGHYRNGAPFIYGEDCRISLSHTKGLLVVATLPPTPEVDLSEFSLRACMGIDAERQDREQVLKIRDRFLSPREMELTGDDVKSNILAWTIKEAAYKAVLGDGLDIREDVVIERLPTIGPAVPVYDKKEFPEIIKGKVKVRCRGALATPTPEMDNEVSVEWIELTVYSYESEGCIVTLAYSPKCAKFGTNSL